MSNHLATRSLLVAATLVATAFLTPSCLQAREDVPEAIHAQTNAATLTERDVKYLTRQFKGKCARCHGLDGSGKGDDATGQTIPPADFTDRSYMSTRTDGDLYYQIFAGGGERCAMPAFGPGSDHGWTEEKIWRMVAFVRRFASPAEP